MIKASDLVSGVIAEYQKGCGYIWGTTGQLWTEKLQAAGSKENNAKTQAYGRQWLGYNVYDCSGLPYAVCKKLGLSIPHGCNGIWKNGHLSEKGKVSDYPYEKRKPGMPVFLTSGTDRHHMGTYIGGGLVVEAKGTQTGVVVSKFEAWDECGFYKGVEYDLPYDYQLPDFVFDVYRPINGFMTSRSGSAGASVRYLQVLLREYHHADLTVDSYFGSSTLAAVKAFQKAHGLTVDGIVGPMTIAALEKRPDDVVNNATIGAGLATGCESEWVEDIRIVTRITDEAGRTFDPVGAFHIEVLLLNQDGEEIGEMAND